MSRTRVLIVGGGIAGVSLGAELARDHDVVVVEAENALAMHSTGRSAALYLEGYGPPAVQMLTRASGRLFAKLEREQGRPLLFPRGAVLTAWDAAAAAVLGEQIHADANLEELTAAQVRKLCPVVRADGVVCAATDRSARDIDVMALHQVFSSTLRHRGGQTVTSARLVSAQKSSTGWTARTEDGRQWTADVLVNAAGAWGDEVARMCDVAVHELTPRRRTVVVARTSEPIDPGWPVVADAGEAWYFKPESGAVLLSPGDETPAEPGDAKPEPIDVATALDRVNAVTTLELRSVQSAWAGLRTFAVDRAPVVGPHPDDPSLFCFLGQGGYGIQMAPALAQVAGEILRRGGSSLDGSLAQEMDPGRIRDCTAAAHPGPMSPS